MPRAWVLRNNGGSFSSTGAGLPGVENGAAVWGDYDNDGDLDILLSGDTGSGIISEIYRNDPGGFTDINAGLPGVRYSSADWGDYDNDGDLDLLLAGYDNSAALSRIYENNSGIFTDIGAGLVGMFGGFAEWGDYDADGDLDILLGGAYAGSSVDHRIYENSAGVFTDSGAWLLTAVLHGDGAWGDYDNDGELEILVSGETSSHTRVTRVLDRNHLGDWGAIGAGLVGMDYSAVAWGDFDNDGDLDIITCGRQTVNPVTVVYTNDSATANTPPAAPTNLQLSRWGNTATFSWNAAADAETPTAGLTYNLRVGTTLYGDEAMSAMSDATTGFRRNPDQGNVGHNLSWRLTVPSGDPVYWSVQAIDAAYVGSPFGTYGSPPQVLSVVPGANSQGFAADRNIDVSFSLNVADDTFTGGNLVVHGSRSGLHEGSIGSTQTSGRILANIDPFDDFLPGELVTGVVTTGICATGGMHLESSYSWSYTIGAGGASGFFDSQVVHGAGLEPEAVRAADLDGDGDVDLLVANGESNNVSVLMNEGGGSFTAATDYSIGFEPEDLVVADLDGDGDMDLAVAKGYGDEVSTRLNNGSGGFTTLRDWPTGDVPLSVEAADLDGDGDMDLIAGNAGGASVSVLMNHGDATFADHVVYATDRLVYDVAAADLDRDGDMDLAVVSNVDDCVSILLNEGDGTFAPFTSVGMDDGPVRVALADVNGDRQVDLVTANSYAENVTVRLNQGNAVFGAMTVYASDSPWDLCCSDLNGDGYLDLVVTYYYGFRIYCRLNLGDGTFGSPATNYVGQYPRCVVSADLDGDGDMDLATANRNTDNVSVLLNQGPTPVSDEGELPTVTRLLASYPNPFNPQTLIAFELPRREAVSLRVYDVSGRLVRTLIDGEYRDPGRHEALWEGCDFVGRQCASGTYVYRLEAGPFSESRRMMLLK